MAAALAIPLVGLVAGAAIGSSIATAQSGAVARQAEAATASVGYAGLVSALQDERDMALVDMLDLGSAIDQGVATVGATRRLTDLARAGLDDQIAGSVDGGGEDDAAAMATLRDLPGIRARVDAALAIPGSGNRAAAQRVFGDYTRLVSRLLASHDRVQLVVDDAGLRQGDDLVREASRASDAASQLVERLLRVGSGRGGLDQPGEAAAVAALARDVERHNLAIETGGSGDYAAATARLLADPRVAGLVPLAGEAVATGGEIDTAELLATAPLTAGNAYLDFRGEVAELLEQRADGLRAQADARRRWHAGGALAAAIVAVVVAAGVSRSITRPLRTLSREARRLATDELPRAVSRVLSTPVGSDIVAPPPAPISLGTNAEVRDVAQALDDVQRATLALAVEQATLRRNIAESYINLGRRNQNLLSRLLGEIGELERLESDPERIRHLHKLDHLATRIRRNAASLLVLSDVEAPHRWQPPVRILDVVRAALGEIENYQRVVVRTLDPVTIVGGAAADLTHLLAELIENGVKHSPPHELVEIRGRTIADGYTLAVIDHGLGMSPAEISRANQRLAGAEPPSVALTKHLGHLVAAALAHRNAIGVRLEGSEVVGIAAIVELPPTVMSVAGADGPRALEPPRPRALPPAAASPDQTPPSTPARALPAAAVTPDAAPPAVTAGGLVRRVRGAPHPAAGPLVLPGHDPPPADAPSGCDARPAVDPAEIERFLTSLAAGVQRSLADSGRPTGAAEET
jgi:hypothetical protein